MKQDSRSIVGEVAKSSCICFDELNGAIKSFGACVAYSVPTVVEQTSLMASEHLNYFFNRLQTTAHGVTGPCVKEAFGRPPVVIAPKLRERFFNTPCPAGLEVELIQSSKRNRLGAAPMQTMFRLESLSRSGR